MNVVASGLDLASALASQRAAGRSVSFVPTMGALHEGHLSLVRLARASDVVVVSIFVNPLQFGAGEDFERYPRDPERDLELLRREAVDLVFTPSIQEMYPPGASTRVTVGRLGEIVEGRVRPGHFEGVATVVTKLFNLVRPERAFFGQKDAQQLAVIRRMVRDLSFGTEVVAGATVRDRDGVAFSSRNAYLSPDERAAAPVLFQALQAGRRELAAGADVEGCEKAMWDVLSTEPLVAPDYARAVDPDTFEDPSGYPILLVVAARTGSTRLIDNDLVAREER